MDKIVCLGRKKAKKISMMALLQTIAKKVVVDSILG